MPKMKSHRGAAKRFRVTGTGKIIRRKGYGSHLLTKKTAKRKRTYSQPLEVSGPDRKKVKRLIGQ